MNDRQKGADQAQLSANGAVAAKSIYSKQGGESNNEAGAEQIAGLLHYSRWEYATQSRSRPLQLATVNGKSGERSDSLIHREQPY